MNILNLKNIHKSYGSRKILNGLNLQMSDGEIVGFLGKNGQGKSTTIKLIMGFLRPDNGIIELFENRKPDFSRIGFLQENPFLWDELTASEFLDGLSRIADKTAYSTADLLKFVGLDQDGTRPVGQFSRGMKQRLGLAQTLISDPDLLILDEPMTALDPIGRIRIKEILIQLKGKKKSIFFSSHQLLEVQEIADRVVILDQGTIVSNLKTSEIGNLESHFIEIVGRK
ncbi:MAG: ABC transporter ATP-binding protein [Candidatus Wallbacteria bacterium]|nr:ABC transporter ATP-binding protein [Candidatus Wallbacteria bacterium]